MGHKRAKLTCIEKQIMVFAISIPVACVVIFLTVGYIYLKIVVGKRRHFDLNGCHVLVTGGSSGIGKAVAEAAARCGANVTLMARNKARLEKARDDVNQRLKDPSKQKVQSVQCDVSIDFDVVQKAIQKAEEQLGPVDVLVNSAGTSVALTFEDTKMEDFSKLMNLNYLGTVRSTKAVLGQMKRRGQGVIVCVSSLAGQMGVYGFTAYSASKCALRGFAESLQMEVQPYGIHIMLTFPPDTNTPGFQAENESKPEECALISEAGGLFEAETVGKSIVQDIQKGKFQSYQGFDGFMLATLTCGMSPASSVGEALIQSCTMGITRFVCLAYLLSFRRIVDRCYYKKLHMDNADSDKSD